MKNTKHSEDRGRQDATQNSEQAMRRFVMAAAQKYHTPASTPHPPERILGAFIEAALTNLGRTRADFAQGLDMDSELADALLDAELPAELLSDRTLVDIARYLDYDANLLRILLGRAITPIARDHPTEPSP